jgi:flagellar motor switch protein FliN/FliY
MMTRDEILNRFVTELTRVVGALLETSASSRPGTARAGDGFLLTFAASDGQQGGVEIFFARPGAEALAQALAASDVSLTDPQIIESLKDVSAQAMTALGQRDLGCTLHIVNADVASDPQESTEPDASTPPSLTMDIVVNGHEQPLQLVLSGHLEHGAVDAEADRGARSKTLDVIMDIDLPLVVRFGRTELSLKALTALGPGSVIDLGRLPDEPVDVLISNRVVARGEVVIVSGNYGVRVRDVVSAAERARSLEAELA